MSFTATIIACYVGMQGSCMTITDNRGPYDTEKMCQTRLEEMVDDLVELWSANKMPMEFKLLACTYPDGQTFI